MAVPLRKGVGSPLALREDVEPVKKEKEERKEAKSEEKKEEGEVGLKAGRVVGDGVGAEAGIKARRWAVAILSGCALHCWHTKSKPYLPFRGNCPALVLGWV